MKLKSLSELAKLLPEDPEPQRPDAHKGHDGKGKKVHLRINKNGRKGKTVTIISGLQHNPATMQEIASILKAHCGAGGTEKGSEIEIQGDQREKLKEKLGEMNYSVSS